MLMEGPSRQSPHARKTVWEWLIECLKLLAGSSSAGFSVAVLQH